MGGNILTGWKGYLEHQDPPPPVSTPVQLLVIYFSQFTRSSRGVEETPLSIACAENFQEAAGVLIEAGAKTDYLCSVGYVF